MKIKGKRLLGLLLALVMLAGLLPALGMTARAEEDIYSLAYDEEGNIHVLTLWHNYTEVGHRVGYTYALGGLAHAIEGVIFDKEASVSDCGFDLIEKDTGRIVPIIPYSDEERFDYKRYTLRVYLQTEAIWVRNTLLDLRFADDVQICLGHHVDKGITDKYVYLPVSHFYFMDEDGHEICAEFDLDFSYFNAFSFGKTIISPRGDTLDVGYPVAWFNKDDIMGDGTASFDPDTGTLHLKGDVDRLWFNRWAGEDPPSISVDSDVNVNYLYLNSYDYDKLVIGGAGTLNLRTLQNGTFVNLILSNCSAYIENWADHTVVELEDTKLAGPAGAFIDYIGHVYSDEGFVKSDVAFRRDFKTLEDSGDAGSIHWHYDFATKTFSVSGSGRFERLSPYDKYLDVAEYFRTESGVTQLGDNIIKDSPHLKKVFLSMTVKRIGRNNFSGCKNLTEANLPIGLEYISSGCFSGSGLKTVTIPKTLLRIDDGCFSRMPELDTILFPYNNEANWLVIGDDCFAHLPWTKEIRFGDGPWIVGSSSFCDMPRLRKVRMVTASDSWLYSNDLYRIKLGNSLRYIGDYSFSDIPKANYRDYPLKIGDNFPSCYQNYQLPYMLRDIGRGSLGFENGAAGNVVLDSVPPPASTSGPALPFARYAWANRLPTISRLTTGSKVPGRFNMGDVSYKSDGDVVGEYDIEALLEYLNRPVKAIGPGARQVGSGDREALADVDVSAQVDHTDLILIKRYVAGWSGLDRYFDREYLWDAIGNPLYVQIYRYSCESNYTADTGLRLRAGSVTADYEDGTTVRVPVFSSYNEGYIGGSVTAKWNPDAMDLIDIEYNDALAPDNGTGPIDNSLSYALFTNQLEDAHMSLDYAGEHVIRFGDDFRTSNITGTGELFTLVFRLKEGAKPDDYNAAKILDFDVSLKGFDIYNADLDFVRTELVEAGTITVRGDDAVIRTVNADDVVIPLAGQKPAFSVSVPTGAPYKLMNTSLGSIVWLNYPKNKDGYYMVVEKKDTFEAGKEYMVSISLERASDAFLFPDAAEIKGTINGAFDADVWVSDDHTQAALTAVFTCAEGVPATGLVLNKTDAALTVGESTGLQVVTFIPYEAADLGVSWQSSDSSVAVVDPNGKVTALKSGTAVITAISANGGVHADCSVTVEKRAHTIRALSVTDVCAPVPKRAPSFTASVPLGAHYRISDKSLFGGGVVWLGTSADDSLYTLYESSTFTEGGTYRVLVYIDPEETATDVYRFLSKEEMSAVLNGHDAEIQWVSDDGTQACVQYMFTAEAPWRFDKTTGSITTSDAVTSSRPVIVASYDENGRFLGSVFVTGAKEKASVVKDGADRVSIFWVDIDTGKPLYDPETVTID